MSDIKFLTEKIKQFNKERDWDQFHTPKDLAIALNIETSELLDLFLWKRNENVNVEKVKEEMADIFMYAFNIADKFGLDINEIIENKLKINAQKYPVEKAKGKSDKYDEL
ncbi:nucleotide pyrophosphohydrolase [Elizabethkingia meningoseptica]|uniref:nucleotide pyrophosphohydrolase n=1 Tax=Elizabethkingia meningoseptica TaxID=238 RepID=UPI0008418FCA|nr:nucleotide pyrophosphohydrolase [Elizabethkingia meningoseptica]ODM52185.1 nucleotide pyrophosphohydrolase [Elizabethkingia meningoseptica]OHT27014.1 nucleotide pyrophosphohydrolase [Elizabethkingia meningoseptica]OPC10878.1 nucleotide pyrophosphohydrolase [Elizabethkingia meningoseptica]